MDQHKATGIPLSAILYICQLEAAVPERFAGRGFHGMAEPWPQGGHCL